jgi:hypothetical protein
VDSYRNIRRNRFGQLAYHASVAELDISTRGHEITH